MPETERKGGGGEGVTKGARERGMKREREGEGEGDGKGEGELWVVRTFFDFIHVWIGGCGKNVFDFARTLHSLFCFQVCSRFRFSRGVPGASPTCVTDERMVDGGWWMGLKKVL